MADEFGNDAMRASVVGFGRRFFGASGSSEVGKEARDCSKLSSQPEPTLKEIYTGSRKARDPTRGGK